MDQSNEILSFFTEESLRNEAVNLLFTRIKDRHNRVTLLGLNKLKQYQKKLGNAFSFSPLNPSGHYCLNLADPIQLEVTKCLLYINKCHYERITKGDSIDKSQLGNKSCFRNEKINKGEFKWSPSFVPPEQGTFEFDFVCLH